MGFGLGVGWWVGSSSAGRGPKAHLGRVRVSFRVRVRVRVRARVRVRFRVSVSGRSG